MGKMRGSILSLLGLWLMASCAGSPSGAEIVELRQGWEYRWGDPLGRGLGLGARFHEPGASWSPFSLPGNPPGRGGRDQLWMRIRLPAGSFPDPVLYCQAIPIQVAVYLDGKAIYGYGDVTAASDQRVPGLPFHLIPLPPQAAGKTVTLRIQSSVTRIGIDGVPLLGSRAAIITHILQKDLDLIAMTCLFCFVGLGALLIFLARPEHRANFHMAGFAFTVAGYTIFWSQVKQLVLGSDTFWLHVWALSMLFMPVFVCGYHEQVFGAGPWSLIRRCKRIHLGYALAMLALISAFGLYFVLFLPLFLLMMASITMCYLVCLRAAVRGDPDARIVITCMTLLLGFGLFDACAGLGLIPWPGLYTHWGMALYLLSLGTIQARRFAQVYRNLQTYSAELESKNRALTELDRLKNEFFAKTTHELRTPLNAIINLPEIVRSRFTAYPVLSCTACGSLFQRTGAPEPNDTERCPDCQAPGSLASREVQHYEGDLGEIPDILQRIVDSGRSLLSIINNILQISEHEGKQGPLELKEFPLQELMDSVLELVRPLAEKKEIQLSLPKGLQGLTVRADFAKLGQALHNLCDNAIKFSPRASEVELRCQPEGDGIRISVHDQGIGISREHQDLIFESFRQVDEGATRKFGGVGLGLPVTKRIVEQHGGTITVDSQQGQGSTFTITLPRGENPPDESR